jgi:hypothetical protein
MAAQMKIILLEGQTRRSYLALMNPNISDIIILCMCRSLLSGCCLVTCCMQLCMSIHAKHLCGCFFVVIRQLESRHQSLVLSTLHHQTTATSIRFNFSMNNHELFKFNSYFQFKFSSQRLKTVNWGPNHQMILLLNWVPRESSLREGINDDPDRLAMTTFNGTLCTMGES